MSRFVPMFLMAIMVSLSAFPLNAHLSALLFFCIAGLLGLVGRQPRHLTSPVLLVILAYALGYFFAIFWPDLYPNLWYRVSTDAIEYAMLWAVRGFGAFALGYAFVAQNGIGFKKIGYQCSLRYKGRLRYTVYVLTSIGWLSILSWALSVAIFGIALVFVEGDLVVADSGQGALLQVLTLLAGLRYPYVLLFLVMHYWKQTNAHQKFLLIAILLISVIEVVASSPASSRAM